jgi:hypothetical protein
MAATSSHGSKQNQHQKIAKKVLLAFMDFSIS